MTCNVKGKIGGGWGKREWRGCRVRGNGGDVG
jgi:hypothetical protein